MINAVVLAAGQSKRMGKPKALLRFSNETFLGHIVSVLNRSLTNRVTVVLGAHRELIEKSAKLSGANVVINSNYEQGQLSSLAAAIDSTPKDTEAMLVCLVDMPFITELTVNHIIREFKATHRPIVLPVFNGRRGHPVLFAKSLFEELRSAPPEQGARYVVHANEEKVLEVQAPDDGIITSIDTPDDYRSRFGVEP